MHSIQEPKQYRAYLEGFQLHFLKRFMVRVQFHLAIFYKENMQTIEQIYLRNFIVLPLLLDKQEFEVEKSQMRRKTA